MGTRNFELNSISPSVGPETFDVSNLYAQQKVFTYDPGFKSTASCKSSITYIDGDAGILRYRGYDIQDVAQNLSFLETSHLLIHGELPNKHQLENLEKSIHKHSNRCLENLIKIQDKNAHPMGSLAVYYNMLSSTHRVNMEDDTEVLNEMHHAIAQATIATAALYRHKHRLSLIPFDHNKNYTFNFLNMMLHEKFSQVADPDAMAKIMDLIFILHADHEQNASTSTVRMVTSTGSEVHACLASGINALWGPLHGGANEAVIKMLDEIGSVENIDAFLENVKNKKCKLMGFGHRIYKNLDPRAGIIKSKCKEVLDILNIQNAKLDVAMEMEARAQSDSYFQERKLYPNVDFYSGIILSALGIPTEFFTNIFVIGRMPGWCAQMFEMLHDAEQKISRPRQIYTGAISRKITTS